MSRNAQVQAFTSYLESLQIERPCLDALDILEREFAAQDDLATYLDNLCIAADRAVERIQTLHSELDDNALPLADVDSPEEKCLMAILNDLWAETERLAKAIQEVPDLP